MKLPDVARDAFRERVAHAPEDHGYPPRLPARRFCFRCRNELPTGCGTCPSCGAPER